MSLSTKLRQISKKVGYIQKDSKNDFHGYDYASAEKVLGKVRAVLIEEGVCVARTTSRATHTTPDLLKVIVHVSITLRDEETNEEATFEGTGEGYDKGGDKAAMKAQTAAVKYAIASAFLISWGDDPEADPATDLDDVKSKLMDAQTLEEVDQLGKWVGSLKPSPKVRPKIKAMFDARRAALAAEGNGNSHA